VLGPPSPIRAAPTPATRISYPVRSGCPKPMRDSGKCCTSGIELITTARSHYSARTWSQNVQSVGMKELTENPATCRIFRQCGCVRVANSRGQEGSTFHRNRQGELSSLDLVQPSARLGPSDHITYHLS